MIEAVCLAQGEPATDVCMSGAEMSMIMLLSSWPVPRTLVMVVGERALSHRLTRWRSLTQATTSPPARPPPSPATAAALSLNRPQRPVQTCRRFDRVSMSTNPASPEAKQHHSPVEALARPAGFDGTLSAQLAWMCLVTTSLALCIYPISAESVSCAVFRMGAWAERVLGTWCLAMSKIAQSTGPWGVQRMCFRSCDEPDPMASAGPDGRTVGEDNGAALGFCRMVPWPQSPTRTALIPSQFPGARNLGRGLDGNIEQWREAKTCPTSQRMS